MRTLIFPRDVYTDIVQQVCSTPEGLETGVTLFGLPFENYQSYVVLSIAGPGRNAMHRRDRYSGDENHANVIYDALQSAMPGIRWLGEVHVHPRGMTWLSGRDLRTVRQILTG